MNVRTVIPRREPIPLTVPSFWMLRQSGAFSNYSKSELIDGELWGVFRQDDDEEESDAEYPIKLSINHYAMIANTDAFDGYHKTELVDGLVYEMGPQYRQHGFIKDELAYRLRIALETLDSELNVATEQSVAIAPYSEPQPDITLTSEPRGRGAIPIASVGLIIEVSATTIQFDFGPKLQVYANASVAEYWIIDVESRLIHQFWTPDNGNYAGHAEIAFGSPVTSRTIAALTITTGTL